MMNNVPLLHVYAYLLGKPLHVPFTMSLDVFYHKLKPFKVHRCHCIKADVKQDQRPFEESIYRVSCMDLVTVKHQLGDEVAPTSWDPVDFMLDEKIY